MASATRLCRILIACCFISIPVFASEIDWVRSYQDGMRLARDTHRPVLIGFSAIWCPPCEKMDREVYNDRRFIEASRSFVFINVDVDHDRNTAMRYGIRAVPTLIFLDPWGNVLHRRERSIGKGSLLRIMKSMPVSFASVSNVYRMLERDGFHPDLLNTLGSFYQKTGFPELARDFFARASEGARFTGIRRPAPSAAPVVLNAAGSGGNK